MTAYDTLGNKALVEIITPTLGALYDPLSRQSRQASTLCVQR